MPQLRQFHGVLLIRPAPLAGLIAAALLLGSGATAGPATLSTGEQTIIEIFKRVSPGVVSVANKAYLRDLFSWEIYEVPRGLGSGFVWDREGHIISNFHVVYGAAAIQVTLRDGATYQATVVGVAPDYDIAVLKIDAPRSALCPVEPGSSRDVQVGQTVLAIGNPFGLDTSLSVGVVSALGRSIVSLSGHRIRDVIQTDAAINPGNSGGPLLDSSGRLIGMNTAILSPSGAYAGVGFAVPVDTIKRVVSQLLATGRVRRAGVGVRLVPEHITRERGVKGVAILSVLPRSPAEKAGLRGVKQAADGNFEFGDVLVELDGLPVNSAEDVVAVMERHQAGDKITAAFLREGRRLTVEIVLENVD